MHFHVLDRALFTHKICTIVYICGVLCSSSNNRRPDEVLFRFRTSDILKENRLKHTEFAAFSGVNKHTNVATRLSSSESNRTKAQGNKISLCATIEAVNVSLFFKLSDFCVLLCSIQT